MIPEDWSSDSLDALISLNAGVSVNSEDRPKKDEELGVLKISAVTYGIFDPTAHKAVLKSEERRVATQPRKDSIILSRSNTLDLVGASAYVDRDYDDLFLPDTLWQTTKKRDDYSVRWLSFVLASERMRKKVSNIATGTSGSMKKISMKNFLALKVEIPPLPEQRKIAEILSAWDEAISLAERLIAAKQRRKKALMQQLLTGKRRFREFVRSGEKIQTKYGELPMDWEYVPIAEVARKVSAKNKDGNDWPVLSCTKYDGLVDSLKYFGRQVFSKDTSTYKVVKRGQFAYATNHIEEGSIGYQNLYDYALISPMYTVFETNSKVNDAFLYKVLKMDLYRHIFEVNTSASVDRRGSLRWDAFSLIKVPLPSIPEQRKIAAVFQTCDEEIELLEQKLAALKQQKKGLMQKLLTGQVRVRAG